MWRSFLHWLGGMGVIVFLLAIIPRLGGQQNIFLMKAESPGPIDKGKDIPGSYEYMHSKYPFITPWLDSLQTTGALRDTFIINRKGRQLHAMFASAAKPTDKTAVIVHGYTDNAIRMLMIGYLYNNDLNYNILLPDLQDNGLSEGPAISVRKRDSSMHKCCDRIFPSASEYGGRA